MASEGCNRLARILEDRIKDYDDKPPILDFGEIQGDLSLVTNYFPVPIPQSDYIVCRSVLWGGWLQAGSSVLVAWVGVKDEDHEAVVIDVIYPASRGGV